IGGGFGGIGAGIDGGAFVVADVVGGHAAQGADLGPGPLHFRVADLELGLFAVDLKGGHDATVGRAGGRPLVAAFVLFQVHYRSKNWIRSIDEQRIQIKRLVQDNPHLKSYMLEAINSAYGDAVKLAAKETGIAQTRFPAECAYSIEQLLDEDFYPN
ncbi:MAG: DUF29 domain-containing protein, partial [Pseudomonadota bacterium]|nr:DUF29 domain-containing protein [Pseudomonadota bacterium]